MQNKPNNEREAALLAVLAEFKIGAIDIKQAAIEINQIFEYYAK